MPRPRRTAALRANEAITDMADSDRPMSRERRARGTAVSRDPPSSPPGDHLNLNIKVSSNKLRQATVGRDGVRTEQQISVNSGRNSGRGAAGRRSRGGRKNYVVESDSDEEEEEELDLGDDDDDEDAEGEEDADGEVDEMELDADGEADDDPGEEDADADGDVDMDGENSTITVVRPKGAARGRQQATANPAQRALYEEDDDDDEELSDPGSSNAEDSITYNATRGGEDGEDAEDAEGEEIEVAGEEEEEAEEEAEEVELDSDGEPIVGEAPDVTKMTRRQRARFEDKPQDYMKLSDGRHFLTPLPPPF